MGGYGAWRPFFVGFIIYWCLVWFCYTVVYSGTHVLLSKRRKGIRASSREEFSVAGLAAALSILIPVTVFAVLSREISIGIPVVVIMFNMVNAVRNMRSKAIDRKHYQGDMLGYWFALAVCVTLHFVTR